MQLRTGYTNLNQYRCKTGQTEDPTCRCGQYETPSHYLLECPLYEDTREDMLKSLSTIGLRAINTSSMMSQLEGEQTTDLMYKLETVAAYINSTDRFNTAATKAQP